MFDRDNKHLESFAEATKQWTDSRLWSRDDLFCAYIFTCYLGTALELQGVVLRGFSWREGQVLGTLVIKGLQGEAAVVAFISGKTLPEALRILARKIAASLLDWRADRFA